ncbi:arylsulfatase A-like enzyme [Prosthecobacter fusiformis]|uniref:Arylsulfatase A-like enzyme n=1 Tax=Prosthecobacter fusiformis TaxID=48464 RepID=A0A4R7SQE8_9BACT|nr:sulfatase-like hydrolase/transferase [Prosthecobacter fusiformis]TDU81460.1 arylsulfatase A-like enzyme [Prosthecobacter fusiformis]
MRYLLLSLLCLAVPAFSESARPNIVYIIADDHAFRDFGFMGSKEAMTPNLDKLASQSARFVNGYVTTSLCSPSLGVMLTGRYPHQSSLTYNHPPPGNSAFNKMATRAEYEKARSPAFEIIRRQPTLPRALGQLGYHSLQTGKFWEGHFSNAGFTEGMTLFEPRPGQDYGGNRVMENGQLAAHGNGDHGLKIGRETMQPIADFLDRTAGKQPFFIWYAPFLPHQPHDSPQRFFDLHQGRGIAAHKIPYLASISQFDDSVGELIAMLESRSLTKNTLIVFISDNGWTPSLKREKKKPDEFAHTLESKYSPFEDGLRTPILFRWDGHVQPATHEQLVSSVDLLPTVLEALGTPDIMPGLPGRSLWQAAQGKAQLEQQPVFGEIYPGDATALGQPSKDIAYRWVRDGSLKLLMPHNHHEKTAWRGYVKELSLFDVVKDPGEKHNLASTHPQDVQRLLHLLNQWWNPGDDSAAPKP